MSVLLTLLTVLLTLSHAPFRQDDKPCDQVDGGSHVLTAKMKATLASRYRSWEVRRQCAAEVSQVTERDPKWASVASGDYDADGRIDQAVLLQSKTSPTRLIIVVFMTSVGDEPARAGDGNLYISTIPRGGRGHNYDTEQDFTYTRDAIFSGDFHCCGFSLLWQGGKFIRIATSN